MKARLARGLFLDRDLERFRQQLAKFQPFLSRKKLLASLDEFDATTEQLISLVFGEASDQLEAYQYAKLGEAASLVNLPEEAQEGGAEDIFRESLQQRKRVIESCISELEERKASVASRNGRTNVLTSVKVADYMSHDVRSVHRDATIKEAGRLLQKWRVGSLLVDDGLRYIGIITDTDLSRKAVARGLDPNTTTVKQCMSKSIVTIEDTEPMTEAIRLMKENGVRHLPVTEDGTIIGVLSVSDLLRAYDELSGLVLEGGADEDGAVRS
ncbi:MAG TPA: CBS domain-containing protein [Nitrospiraceae bacterium]|jgi:CBS domain-containing protein|nr:CBS domain-containing protein [Nitrospiraceae bacterium]